MLHVVSGPWAPAEIFVGRWASPKRPSIRRKSSKKAPTLRKKPFHRRKSSKTAHHIAKKIRMDFPGGRGGGRRRVRLPPSAGAHVLNQNNIIHCIYKALKLTNSHNISRWLSAFSQWLICFINETLLYDNAMILVNSALNWTEAKLQYIKSELDEKLLRA